MQRIFRTEKSTTQAILHFQQYMDSGKVVFAVSFDFLNAFDCIHRVILLSNLNTYGIRGGVALIIQVPLLFNN